MPHVRFWDMGYHEPWRGNVFFSVMPRGLIRYHHTGDFHFITFSCFHRHPHLASVAARDLLQNALERTRRSYHFAVGGYVVMPEHIHLLMGEPPKGVSDAMHALRLSVTLRRSERGSSQSQSSPSQNLPYPKRLIPDR